MRPYLRVQNVFEDRLDLSDVMEMDFSEADFERYRLHPGDIQLNEGQSPEFLGRPALYRGEIPGACFTNTLIRFHAYSHVVPECALIVFRHHMRSGRYRVEGNITTNIAHLGAGRFGEVEFLLSSRSEQAEIVSRVESLFAYADRLEARYKGAREHVERLTPASLAKAFHGELVPQNPNDEPACLLLECVRARTARTQGIGGSVGMNPDLRDACCRSAFRPTTTAGPKRRPASLLLERLRAQRAADSMLGSKSKVRARRRSPCWLAWKSMASGPSKGWPSN